MLPRLYLASCLALTTWACSEYDLSQSGDALGADTAAPGGGGDGGSGGGPLADGDYDCGVTGRVCDPSSTLYVPGARVYAEIDSDGDGEVDSVAETYTDEDGYFDLQGLPCDTPLTVHVEKGSFSTSYEVEIPGGTYELPQDICLTDDDVRIAVVTGEYDNIEDILDDLSLDYDLIRGEQGTLHVDLMRDPAHLAIYDIIFLNCGMADGWTNYAPEIGANLRAYVEGGGSVYASDWSHYAAEVAFSSAIDFYGSDGSFWDARAGVAGSIDATVLDANMQALLGSSNAALSYDLSQWAVAEAVGQGATTLIRGDARATGLGTGMVTVADAPLAVEIEAGAGRFIYTSFHNERQRTVDMEVLLMEIILSL